MIRDEQRTWFLRLETERDNLRTALQWLSCGGEDVLALRLAAALGYFWWMRGYFAEGQRYLEDLLERVPGEAADPHPRTRALQSLGLQVLVQGEVERARRVLEESLAVARSTGEARSIAFSFACLGRYETLVGKPERGIPFSEEALARSREAGDGWSTARALHELGVAALHDGDYTTDSTRGKALGRLTAAVFLGQFLSPLVSQPVGGTFGLDVAFVAAAVLAMALAVALAAVGGTKASRGGLNISKRFTRAKEKVYGGSK